MSNNIERPPRKEMRHDLDALRGEWGWFVALGAALTVLGLLAISAPYATTLVTVLYFGWLLLIAGFMQGVGAFWARDWSGFFLSLLAGILYVVVGVLFIRHPLKAGLAATLVVVMLLMVTGIFRIAAGFAIRHAQWLWVVVSGVLNLALAFLIWNDWPDSALWVIGLFLGIELLFTGATWIAIGLRVRKLPKLEL